MKKTNKTYKNLLVKTNKEKNPKHSIFMLFRRNSDCFLGWFWSGEKERSFIYLFNCQGAEHSSFYIAFTKYLLN